MATWTKITVAAMVMAAAAGAGAGPAAMAADTPAVHGTITAVGEGTVTFQVSTEQKVTVAVNEATVVKVSGQAAKLADLKVGMMGYAFVKEGQPATEIRAAAKSTTTGHSTTAGPHPTVAGTITAVGADTITLQPGNSSQPVTVSVNAATTYQVQGKSGQLADLKVGMRAYAVVKEGQPATKVSAYTPGASRPPAAGGTHPAVGGTVTAIAADTITLQPGNNGQAVTVSVNAATKFQIQGKPGQFADLKVGMRAYAFVKEGQPATEVRAYTPTR